MQPMLEQSMTLRQSEGTFLEGETWDRIEKVYIAWARDGGNEVEYTRPVGRTRAIFKNILESDNEKTRLNFILTSRPPEIRRTGGFSSRLRADR